jgi:hypothetical protein
VAFYKTSDVSLLDILSVILTTHWKSHHVPILGLPETSYLMYPSYAHYFIVELNSEIGFSMISFGCGF